MLGVMTENTSVLNGEDRPQKRPKLSEDFVSPQRSILDFFKGSGKSGDRSKPKDLFGYFTKVTDKGAVNCNGDVHDKKEKIQKENGPLTIEDKASKDVDCKVKKGKKRKHSVDSKGDKSLEDFDVEDKKETFKQKRQREIAEKMKKYNGIQQEQEKSSDCKEEGNVDDEISSKCNGIDEEEELQPGDAKENIENKSKTTTENGESGDVEVVESTNMNIDSSCTELDNNCKDEPVEVDIDFSRSDKADANNLNCDKDDKHVKKKKHKKSKEKKDINLVMSGTENNEALSVVDDKNEECKTKKKDKKNDNKRENLDTSGIEKNDMSVLEGQSEEIDVKKKEKRKKLKTPAKSKSKDQTDEDETKEHEYVNKLINKMALLTDKRKKKNSKQLKVQQEEKSEEVKNEKEKGKDEVEKEKDKVMELSYTEYIQNLNVDESQSDTAKRDDDNTEDNGAKNENCDETDGESHSHVDIKEEQGEKIDEDDCSHMEQRKEKEFIVKEKAEKQVSKVKENKLSKKHKDSKKVTKEKEVMRDETENKEEEKTEKSEMSYSEFLDSLGQNEDGDDKDNMTEQQDTTQDEESDKASAKKYPSVANFFTKITKDMKNSKKENEDSFTVTVKADIHPFPSPPRSKNKEDTATKSSKKKSPTLEKQEEIEILGSEIIDAETIKKPRKNRKNNSEPLPKTEPTQNSSDKNVIEDSNDVCILSDNSEINTTANEEKSAFLQSTTKPVVPQKTTQTTLSFGKGPVKSEKLPQKTRVRKSNKQKEEPLSESTPIKPDRGHIIESVLDESESSINVTPIKTSEDLNTSGVSERRKSLRQKYKVALLDMNNKKGSPIRIRLKRYDKSSSSMDDETFTPKSNKRKVKGNTKLSKAQELLHKAKKSKHTKRKESLKTVVEKTEDVEEVSEKPGRRRSARLEHHRNLSKEEADIVIVDDEDDDDIVEKERDKRKKKTQKAKATPSKCKTPNKSRRETPKKGTPKKLASIFCPKGKQQKENKPVVPLDPEKEKMRREFLMSGVPDELKRQNITSTPVFQGDYPPLPLVSHIQQRIAHLDGHTQQQDSNLNKLHVIDVWELPEVKINFGIEADYNCVASQQNPWFTSFIDKSENVTDLQAIKSFTKHKIQDTTHILTELQQFCPSYPVNNMYKVLKDKVDIDTEDTTDNGTKTDNKDIKDKTKIQEEKEKKIKRRSLRLKRKEEDVIIIGSPEPKDEQKTGEDTNSTPDLGLTLPSLLWTEKYQPEHSSEIVGNSALVKKLKSWLLEWKQRVDREARRAKMLLMKQKKKNQEVVQEDEWWADDSSDFDMDSDDSDDEYDRLCNTVMLVGPTGIGKTATVYALAEELGYKVFEVNASSSRNGKRILSQLQEATQSHQVANHKEKTVGTPSKKTHFSTTSKTKDTLDKKLPTSFANLFKKASTSSAKPEKTPTTPSKSKKRKRKEDNFVEEKTPKKKKTSEKPKSNTKKLENKKDLEAVGSKGRNLTSTSLILFEELDIAFDEDKGFWSAVQHFMSTTKIPIILTTDDPSFSTKFEGRFELYSFKTPSLTNATLYLQLICLVENVRTDSREIYELLTLNKGDIRKTLLSLQYILDSGGGVKQLKHQISLNSNVPQSTILPLDENTCSQDSQNFVRKVDTMATRESFPLLNHKFDDGDDDDDFVSLKPVRSSARRLISDDENSCSDFQHVGEKKPMEVTSDAVMEAPVTSSETNGEVISGENLPLVHRSCLDSVLGLHNSHCERASDLLDKFVKEQGDQQLTIVTQAYQQYLQLKCNILYNHYLELLPLPKVEVKEIIKMQAPVKNKKRKRIKQTFDLYDSEASNDASQDETEKQDVTSDVAMETVKSKEENLLLAQSLSSFAEFYDSLSFTDCLRSVPCNSNTQHESDDNLRTGISDKLVNFEPSNARSHLDSSLLCCELDLCNFKRLYERQKEIISLEKEEEDLFCVPVLKDKKTSLLDSSPGSSAKTMEKVTSNVISNLPLSVYTQRKSVTLDYMPVLRSISQTEQIRQQSKAKRRFHHYFDNIGLCLRESTLNVLCQPL